MANVQFIINIVRQQEYPQQQIGLMQSTPQLNMVQTF